jgi:signal transduction histidine kinase
VAAAAVVMAHLLAKVVGQVEVAVFLVHQVLAVLAQQGRETQVEITIQQALIHQEVEGVQVLLELQELGQMLVMAVQVLFLLLVVHQFNTLVAVAGQFKQLIFMELARQVEEMETISHRGQQLQD